MAPENLEGNLKRHVIELSENIAERNYLFYDALNKTTDYVLLELSRA